MSWAHVQSVARASVAPATTSTTLSFASNVTANNRLFAFISATAGSNAASNMAITATDSQGNTWSKIASLDSPGTSGSSVGSYPNVSMWTAVASTSGPLTLTVGYPSGNIGAAGSELGFSISEYSGLDTSAALGCVDKSATGSGSASPIPTGTTGATTADNQLALAMVGDWGSGSTYTAPAGFTLVANACKQADASAGIAVATKLSASGATEGGSFAYGAGATQALGIIAVIKLTAVLGPAFDAASFDSTAFYTADVTATPFIGWGIPL